MGAPVHTQIYSMKDQRQFAGLGTGANVPPFLRTDNFVKHIYLSKGEIEDYMGNFLDELLTKDRSEPGEPPLSTQVMHTELHQFMKRQFEDHHSLTEFAYAFICGLEAYRDDPDFELFDYMLQGLVHPLIAEDQRSMLNFLERLMRNCQQGEGEARITSRPSSMASREQVSKRVLRAVVAVFFPDKAADRRNALHRAFHLTLQTMQEKGTSAKPGCVFVNDLFAQGSEGSQTPFIEEIRRQHCLEIIEHTAKITKAITERSKDSTTVGYVGDKLLKQVLQSCDQSLSAGVVDRLSTLACPEPGVSVAASEAVRKLRTSALLRPSRLWVEVQPKDVMHHIVAVPSDDGGTPADGGGRARTIPGSVRRCLALKVLNNPQAAMMSETYNTPEGMQKTVAKLQQRAEATELQPPDGA